MSASLGAATTLRQVMEPMKGGGHATPVGLGFGRSALDVNITTIPSANSRPFVVGIGTGTVRPSKSRCTRSSVSHARSALLRTPRRATATIPLMWTDHTSLATPPASGSMRATSSPHCVSASHPTGSILPFTHRTLCRQKRTSVCRQNTQCPARVVRMLLYGSCTHSAFHDNVSRLRWCRKVSILRRPRRRGRRRSKTLQLLIELHRIRDISTMRASVCRCRYHVAS